MLITEEALLHTPHQIERNLRYIQTCQKDGIWKCHIRQEHAAKQPVAIFCIHIYTPLPRWSLDITFYSLGCGCELISDLISHASQLADQKNNSGENADFL